MPHRFGDAEGSSNRRGEKGARSLAWYKCLEVALWPGHCRGYSGARAREKFMIQLKPVVLERDGIRLEPLSMEHLLGIEKAAADGELWKLWYTAVPEPGKTKVWYDHAMSGMTAGNMLPWAVREL